jgi:tRNA modification GTPase
VIREGRTVVILGRPNAGKSSLFNALVGSARAIVTPTPGTTRDLVTETVDIRGLPITLVDTAGLRETGDDVETEGVRRALDAERIAAATLVVIDASRPLDSGDRGLVAARGAASIVVASKSDLPRAWPLKELGIAADRLVTVSALTGDGLDALRDRMASHLTEREDFRDPPPVTNIRHLKLVDEARELMHAAERAIADGATEELILTDLTRARQALEEITGRRTTDDVLARIFQRFCLGK